VTPEPTTKKTGLLAWFATNHVAANLLMFVVIATGVLSLARMRVEVFQEIDTDLIRIQVPYPGASPDEVEQSICQRIEEAIRGIEGIDRVSATAAEGLGTVVAELEDYANDSKVLDDIKLAVDRIQDFPPQDADEPVIAEVDSNIQVISVVLFGDVPERSLKELAENVRDELTAMDEVSLVEVTGAREYEITLEISEAMLRRHQLTFEQVAHAVRRASLDLPAGSIETRGGEILLRTKGQRYVGQDFEDIEVVARADGSKLLLSDVATIIDGFEDSDKATYFDGKRAVMLQVFRVGEQGALDVAKTVEQYVDAKQLPEGVQAATWFSRAEYLRGRMELLIRNATLGLILVFLVLTLFLDLKLAFWTTLGIPISFMGGFVLMYIFGVSVNMISLFALIVVLGIVVDDAIVVGENVFEYRQEGMSGDAAAIRGVREMAMPVTLAVLTTIAAFLPLMYTAGDLGKILWPISLVVVSVLLVSLIEACLILPAHLSFTRFRKGHKGPIARGQQRIRDGLQWVIDRPYTWTLGVCTRWRYATLAGAAAIFLMIMGPILGGQIKFQFLPNIDADNVWASLAMPQGTPIEQTRAAVDRLEDAIDQVRAEIDAKSPEDHPSIIRHVSTTVGDQPFGRLAGGGPGATIINTAGSSHLAEVNVELLSGENRDISSTEIADRWNEAVGELPGATSLTFTSKFFSAGEAVNVQLSHENFDQLIAASDRLKDRLEEFAGVREITDTFEPGKRELQVVAMKPAGLAAGLNREDVARQLRQAFYGEEVQRIQRGRDEMEVRVRYPETSRRSLGDLDDLRIRTPDGDELAFEDVAEVREARGYASINRADRRRVVSVTADVDVQTANANEINRILADEVLPAMKRDIPGLTYTFEGEAREQAESMRSLGMNMLLALMVIYALLAVQFRSYIQPVIIMSVIPFGFVGAVLGHVIMGLFQTGTWYLFFLDGEPMPLSMLSGFGFVALTGVVVNDSLIMIDLINRRRREGELKVRQAVLESGVRRFRPILLTTLTTFFGLMPMILEQSLQAKFLIPMAVSLGFGVLFATFITLILVPTIYLILVDLQEASAAMVQNRGADAPDQPQTA